MSYLLYIDGSLQMTGEKLTDTPAPMDTCMQKLSTDPRVTMHLLPLPRSLKAPTGDPGAIMKRPMPTGDPPVRSPKIKITKPSAKAKSLCPEELKGYKSQDSEGHNKCWSFNMKCGCQLETKDHKCRKGYHKCMKCHKIGHSLGSCRSNQQKCISPAQSRDLALLCQMLQQVTRRRAHNLQLILLHLRPRRGLMWLVTMLFFLEKGLTISRSLTNVS